jgi:lysophospholipase L1-like esterase
LGQLALFIATVFVACLSVALSSDALASQPHSRLFKEATERASVSGKISAIGDASSSVDVKKNQDLVTLQFLINDTTKVEGRLEVGAQATVDYQTNDGINIATHVVVQPSHWWR